MPPKIPHPGAIALNPYDVLEVDRSATNAEITKAMARALKRRQYPAEAIASARKRLMNPQERLLADYLLPQHPQEIQPFESQDFSHFEAPQPPLEFLPEFDTFDSAIADRRVGESLSDFPNHYP